MLRFCTVQVHLYPDTNSDAPLALILCFHFHERCQDVVHRKRSAIYRRLFAFDAHA